jgi:hypothetical protein
VTLPAYDEYAKPTAGELSWNRCKCGKAMQANEEACFGTCEDCYVGGVMNDNDLAREHLQAITNLRIADEMSDGDVSRFSAAMALETQHWRSKAERPVRNGRDKLISPDET